MTRVEFIVIMQAFYEKNKEVDDFLNNIESLLGPHAMDVISSNSYYGMLINTISICLEDTVGWLSFFCDECNWSFEEFTQRVAGHPKIQNYGDLYDFIYGKEE